MQSQFVENPFHVILENARSIKLKELNTKAKRIVEHVTQFEMGTLVPKAEKPATLFSEQSADSQRFVADLKASQTRNTLPDKAKDFPDLFVPTFPAMSQANILQPYFETYHDPEKFADRQMKGFRSKDAFKAQVQFRIQGDVLDQDEGGTGSIGANKLYCVDIEFKNMSQVHIKQDAEQNQVAILIVFEVPCNVVKILHIVNDFPGQVIGHENGSDTRLNKRFFVRSPFNLQNDTQPESILLNMANVKQAMLVRGQGQLSDLETFLNYLKCVNPKAELIIDNQVQTFEPSHESRGRLFPAFLASTYFASKQFLTSYILRKTREMATVFESKMPPQLAMSILSLFSNSNFHVFEFRAVQNLCDVLLTFSEAKDPQFMAFAIDQATEKYGRLASSKLMLHYIKENLLDTMLYSRFLVTTDDLDQNLCRNVIVTQTLILFKPLTFQMSNSVIREFGQNYNSCFMKVSLRDERRQISFFQSSFHTRRLAYFKKVLMDGFRVFSRRYAFLAYSNSQLKSHTFWFLEDGVGFQGESLRAQIENRFFRLPIGLDREQSQAYNLMSQTPISKEFARKAQCFTSTQSTGLQELETSIVDDIPNEAGDLSLTPSDGCGSMSPLVALHIQQKLYSSKTGILSAIQFRCSGSKGVLIVDPSLERNRINLRKSQVKFYSNNRHLLVIRSGTFSPGYLNNQSILLLYCLGMSSQRFFKKQEEAMKFYDLAEIEKFQTSFQTYMVQLKEQGNSPQVLRQEQEITRSLIRFTQSIKVFKEFMQIAILRMANLRADPVVSQIIRAQELHQIQLMQKKHRIPLDNSCVLIGVVDESGVLQENEIFVQYQKKGQFYVPQRKFSPPEMKTLNALLLNKYRRDDSFSTIMQGRALATRSPSVHPGDIQEFECVDYPNLHHLWNVVVFSRHGRRPACNKMSCGDLDGDVYLVTQDQDLLDSIPSRAIKEPAPLQFERNESFLESRTNFQTIQDFLGFFMERDFTGRLANMWIRMSQYKGQEGPNDTLVKELAYCNQISVDFAKHGSCIKLEKFRQLQLSLRTVKEEYFDLPRHLQHPLLLNSMNKQLKASEKRKAYIKHDYDFSIAGKVRLNWEILGFKATKQQDLLNFLNDDDLDLAEEVLTFSPPTIQKCRRRQLAFVNYLQICHKKILMPMTKELKQLMIRFSLLSEGELFSTTLQNDLRIVEGQFTQEGDDEDEEDTHLFVEELYNDSFTNEEQGEAFESLKVLVEEKKRIISSYRTRMEKLVEKEAAKPDPPMALMDQFSRALYFVTMFTVPPSILNGSESNIWRLFKKSKPAAASSLAPIIPLPPEEVKRDASFDDDMQIRTDLPRGGRQPAPPEDETNGDGFPLEEWPEEDQEHLRQIWDLPKFQEYLRYLKEFELKKANEEAALGLDRLREKYRARFSTYKADLREAEAGKREKMSRIIWLKRLFSVPYLVNNLEDTFKFCRKGLFFREDPVGF